MDHPFHQPQARNRSSGWHEVVGGTRCHSTVIKKLSAQHVFPPVTPFHRAIDVHTCIHDYKGLCELLTCVSCYSLW